MGLGVGKGDRCDKRDSRQHEQSMEAGWRWGCASRGLTTNHGGGPLDHNPG